MRHLPLEDLHRARGARFIEEGDCLVPAAFGDWRREYQALHHGAGLLDLSHRGTFRLVGRDRAAWLHRIVTQEIAALPEGRGAYAALLNPQGHMLTDLRVFALPEYLLVDVPAATAAGFAAQLERYLVMERVEIQDVTAEFALLSLQGPGAAPLLATCLGPEICAQRLWDVCQLEYGAVPLTCARVSHCGEDGFDLFVPAEAAAELWGRLAIRRPEFAVEAAGWEALNARRIEAGIPWWGHELDERIVPFEARLEGKAVHLQKGCYIGQEVIARIDARGQVNNLLVGLRIDGAVLPTRETSLLAGEKRAGRLTSAGGSPTLERSLALGFVRREHSAPGTQLRTEGEPSLTVEVAELPFIPHGYAE